MDEAIAKQQNIITAVGIENILVFTPKDRSGAPISYMQAKLQFTQEVTRPITYGQSMGITARSVMKFSWGQKSVYTPIPRNDIPRMATYYVLTRSKPEEQAPHTPLQDCNPHNNSRLLLLPDNQQDTVTIINRQAHISKITWPNTANENWGWMMQILTYIRRFPCNHINTYGSYKKRRQAYDDIHLADNAPAHPDRITSGENIDACN